MQLRNTGLPQPHAPLRGVGGYLTCGAKLFDRAPFRMVGTDAKQRAVKHTKYDASSITYSHTPPGGSWRKESGK